MTMWVKTPPILKTAVAQTGAGQNTTVVAVHAALTSTGKIFYLAGSAYCINTESGPYTARLLDLATSIETKVTMSNDFFAQELLNFQIEIFFFVEPTKLYDTALLAFIVNHFLNVGNNCLWNGTQKILVVLRQITYLSDYLFSYLNTPWDINCMIPGRL